MNGTYQSLSYAKWRIAGTMLFSFPKGGGPKTLFGNIRKYLGPIFHELARQKEFRIVEGHLKHDSVHVCIEVPAKAAPQQACVRGMINIPPLCLHEASCRQSLLPEVFFIQTLSALDVGPNVKP